MKRSMLLFMVLEGLFLGLIWGLQWADMMSFWSLLLVGGLATLILFFGLVLIFWKRGAK